MSSSQSSTVKMRIDILCKIANDIGKEQLVEILDDNLTIEEWGKFWEFTNFPNYTDPYKLPKDIICRFFGEVLCRTRDCNFLRI